ncbi:hypothetical protein [Vreelandella neptunia]|uniref:LIM zinc-binding domain-containing protein n=1 Tax=Vreelandella neptunia TaxID=115551 RepID=A0ABS9SBV9_9GAMM|nr:hypothetical protein [Halomonas neptunia]MCH4813608.1 hypothetical protein [Halomonas neptunia]
MSGLSPTSYYFSPLQGEEFTEHFMDFKHAIVKVEDGTGTLLCNNCGIVIAKGTKHEDRKHYCAMCMSGNCKAKLKKD